MTSSHKPDHVPNTIYQPLIFNIKARPMFRWQLLQKPKQGQASSPSSFASPTHTNPSLALLRRRERWRSRCDPSGRSGCGRCGGSLLSPSTTRRRPPSSPRRPLPLKLPRSQSAAPRRLRMLAAPAPTTRPQPWVSPTVTSLVYQAWIASYYFQEKVEIRIVCYFRILECRWTLRFAEIIEKVGSGT
jgi:hypothetical protein